MKNNLSKLLQLDIGYFIHGESWLTLSTFIAGLGSIALSSLFARLWPADVFGQFSFLTAALSFMSLTVLPGMA